MSDVVAVGLITGAVGVLSSWLSYLGGRQQADAESTRLAQQLRETGRQERQLGYQRILQLAARLLGHATGAPPTADQLHKDFEELAASLVATEVIAPQSVRKELHALSVLMTKINREAEGGGVQRWREVYCSHQEEVEGSERKLSAAMRADVTAGLLPPD